MCLVKSDVVIHDIAFPEPSEVKGHRIRSNVRMSIIRSSTPGLDLAGTVLVGIQHDPWLISEDMSVPRPWHMLPWSSIEFLNISSRGDVLYPYTSPTAMTFDSNTPNSNVLSPDRALSNRYTTTNMWSRITVFYSENYWLLPRNDILRQDPGFNIVASSKRQ